jgi:vancomycin aglycone glucosyltransferase
VALGPILLPAPDYPPPKIGSHYSQSLPGLVNRFLWRRDEQGWNDRFGATLNEERAKVGLTPVRSVLRYTVTDRPLVAADPALAPASTATNLQIVQTGAWFLPDQTALPDELEQFLANGEPPIYFGFGSTRATEQTGQQLLEAARTLGRRAIISQGWGKLSPNDAGPDYLSIGDVNFEKLLGRVAAIVHHGGSGTTAAAARAGKPQVIVPHRYDQYYWAHWVERSGAGVSGPTSEHLTRPALVSALRACLQPEMAARAEALARRIEPHGARKAAEWLVHEFG